MTTTAACCSSSPRRLVTVARRTLTDRSPHSSSCCSSLGAARGRPRSSIATKPTRLGLDLQGGVELVYQGRPTPKVPEVTPRGDRRRDRHDPQAHRRPRRLRAGDPARRRDQISIGLPDVENAERAEEQVGTTAQLQFYDWEPNVFGERRAGRADSDPRAGQGGRRRRSRGQEATPEAERRTARSQRQRDPSRPTARTTRTGDKLYLFDPRATRAVLAGPDDDREELLQELEAERRDRASRRARAQAEDTECRRS